MALADAYTMAMALADGTMTLIPMWQCDIGDHKWVDYPANISQKLEAVYNNTNSEATQSVQYVWPEDGPEGGRKIVYHIYPKGSPVPVQVNSKTQAARRVRRAFLGEQSCKETGDSAPNPKRARGNEPPPAQSEKRID